jgi:uncharacterized protein YqeY
MRGRLGLALRAAMRSRDQAATAALRSALAAIANAEAIDPDARPASTRGGPPVGTSEHLAGAAAGLGAGEAPRKVITEADAAAIVRAEIADRQLAASQYELGGHEARAERLRAEIEVLSAVLESPGTGQ